MKIIFNYKIGYVLLENPTKEEVKRIGYYLSTAFMLWWLLEVARLYQF